MLVNIEVRYPKHVEYGGSSSSPQRRVLFCPILFLLEVIYKIIITNHGGHVGNSSTRIFSMLKRPIKHACTLQSSVLGRGQRHDQNQFEHGESSSSAKRRV